MKHKNYLLILPIVLALLILIGFLVFVPKSTTAAKSAADRATYDYEPVTITYWHPHSQPREEFLNQLIDEFNDTNPYSITVVGEYAGNYSEIVDKVIEGVVHFFGGGER